jgi:hypothetical protein
VNGFLALVVVGVAGCEAQPRRFHDIFAAAAEGEARDIEELLARGGNANARGPDGVTPLMIAAYVGNGESVEMLLRAGADPNAVSPDGRSVLVYACGPPGSADLVRRLLESGANPDSPERSRAPLMEAAWHADADTVRLLLAAGADPNKTDGAGDTAVAVAGGWAKAEDAEVTQTVMALVTGGATPTPAAYDRLRSLGFHEAARLLAPSPVLRP